MNRAVNNGIYEELGARWYEAQDDPVALLRAESRLRNPWVAGRIAAHFRRPARVLDVGCGGGFLSNELGQRGHEVTGLDVAVDSLEVAALHDATGRVAYVSGDVYALPFDDGAFDVVCAMDFLEHVERPGQAIAAMARVLAPGGLFFVHTFNRNWLARLVVIKGVEWFVKNTPPDMHVLHLFLKPDEVRAMCRECGLDTVELRGSRPRFGAAMWRLLRTRVVPEDFDFTFTRSTTISYTGFALRR
jgi:2-polyprenyl-6-hydroxyphenyl methylase/3-demethylubiquinone-9 3-methyltransferase